MERDQRRGLVSKYAEAFTRASAILANQDRQSVDPMFSGSPGPVPVPHPSVLYKAPSYGDDSTSLEPAEAPDAPWVANQQPGVGIGAQLLKQLEDEPQIEHVTGYPFMQLAKRHGVDYGDVLNWAENSNPEKFEYTLSTDARFQLMRRLGNAAAMEIEALMDQPVHLRGVVGHDV